MRRSLLVAAALSMITGTTAIANDVVLISTDGGTRIGGKLLAFDGATYQMETMFGTIEAPANAVTCDGTGCPVEQIVHGWGAPKIGETLFISMNSGAVKLTGTLLAFTEGRARISTQIGDFTIPLDQADCTGPGCPQRTETVTYILPGAPLENVVPVSATTAVVKNHDEHANHAVGDTGPVKPVSDTYYPESNLDTPYEIPPEIRMAGPGEIVEVLMPVALENYAWRHGGVLDLFDDHMVGTEDIGELKHHAGGVGFEIKDSVGDRMFGLLGHHVHAPLEQIQMLANLETDVAFVTGPVTPEEIDIVATAGHGDLNDINQQRVAAVDGYVAIVSPQNPLRKVALDDLQRVFAGQITNWADLGGPNAPINVHTFRTGHETFYKTRDVLLQPAGLEIGPNVNEHRLTREIVTAVMADPNGIGFVSYARRRGARALSLVMACGLEVDATPLTIKTERYPLVQRIAAYNRAGLQDELVADFLDFVESPDFDAGVEKAGFVSLGVESTSLRQDAVRFAAQIQGYSNATEINRGRDVLGLMDGRSSLTAAFRFRTGSAELDQRAQRDLKRVADFINANPNAQYMVVGFADSSGGFPQNEILSLRRANSVVDALRRVDETGRLSGIDLQTLGGGELNAVACNETAAERSTNRRVEIWMKS